MYFVWAGTESIKWLETLTAPVLLLMGAALFVWALARVGGLGTILRGSGALIRTQEEMTSSRFLLTLFLPWLTAMVGYWATLSLNIPDFTRYAKSQKDQAVGQALGLLTTMPLFASCSLTRVSLRRSPRHQAPPCSCTMIGNPVPLGLKRRASNGLSP